jgi:hypothetical protein
MKNASTLLKKYIKKGGAFYAYAVVTLSTGEKLTLTSDRDFMISPNSYTEQGGSDGFPLGVAVSKTITLTIDNIDERYSKYDFYYARIALYTEADIDYQTLEPHIERMQEGVFTVLNPVAIGDVIELTAYDDMWKSDRTFSTQLTYPTTALQLLQEVCTSCGMVLGSPTFRNSDFSISSAPEKTTGRKIIGYIAQLACGNAVIQNGMLTIKTHDFSAFSGITDSTKPESLKADSGYHIFEDFSTDPDIDTDNVVITGISTEVESETGGEAETVISGTDDYCIKITNPLIKGKEQAVVNSIAELLVGVTLRKFSGDFFPNPTVEFMDLACVVDRKDKVYRTIVTTHEFSYLGGSSFSCDINSPERQAGEYYSEAAEIYNGIKKDVASNKNNISNMQNAIELLNTTLENAAGMYESNSKQPDGSVVSFIHDKPTLAESKVVIKVTAEAIGLSNDGGKTYPYGIILTGDLIARILYTVGINADYIISGKISSKNGAVYFDLDNNEIACSSIVQPGKYIINGVTYQNLRVEFQRAKYEQNFEYGIAFSKKDAAEDGIIITPAMSNSDVNKISFGGSGLQINYEGSAKGQMKFEKPSEPSSSIITTLGGIKIGFPKNNSMMIVDTYYACLQVNSGGAINMNQNGVNIGGKTVTCTGKFVVNGTKNRNVKTEDYGDRLQYCYEMASPYFGDIGQGKTDENGYAYIDISDIFSETVRTDLQYQVFLQKEGNGDIWIEEKEPTYFCVKGTPNLDFAWEIKAKQKDYEFERLEMNDTDPELSEPNYEKEGQSLVEEYINSTEVVEI